MNIEQQFRMVDPDVIRVDASHGGAETPHVHWYVGHAPESETELDARVVIATLHAVGRGGGGEIEVGALFIGGSDASAGEGAFAAALAESDALETLYDFARVSLRSVLAIVDANVEIPRRSPAPEIEQLVRRSETPDDASADPA